MQLTAAIGLSLSAVLLLSACQQDTTSGRISTKAKQQENLPKIDIKLPPSPSFEKDHPPVTYPDTSHSIYGLRKHKTDLLSKEVRVKGFVVDVYKCGCNKRKKDCTCLKPHFFIADRLDSKKDDALMVTDYPETKSGPAKLLKPGANLVVGGKYLTSSISGFSASGGLVVFSSAAPAGSE